MIYLNLDLSGALELRKELEPKIQRALNEAARDLATQTHAHILEEVQSKLHSTRDKYIAGLEFKQVNDSTWVISLDKSAMWIEEGMPEHEMLDNLLSSPKAKTAKDGSKYMVVPFDHKKGPTQQTQAQKSLTDTIKQEMAKRKIPYAKVETDANGQPKLGMLHKFDIMKTPLKTHDGPGQGKGPIGQVRQGPTGIPFLQGVRVYQKKVKDQATGKDKVQRGIMTFRVASSKHKGTGRWVHPGLEAKKFFEEAQDWALQQWVQRIVPDIMRRLENSL